MFSRQETHNRIHIKIRTRSLTMHFGRASFLFSFPMKCRASLTVEASLVLPIFSFFMMTILYSLEIVRFQSDVREALYQEATYESFMAYGACYGNRQNTDICAEQNIKEYLEKQLLPYLCVEGNGNGLSIDVKENVAGKDNRKVTVSYTIKPFLYLLPIGEITVTDSVLVHDWTGYQKDIVWNEDKEEVYVYITPTGKKYHLSPTCTYLRVKLQVVNIKEVSGLRNADGKIYYPCKICGTEANSIVYLTKWGTRYHGKNDCEAIEKNVSIVPISQAGERTVCSKCGNGGE